jgi:D-glycero-alpha-D-manno-heptose-7-phosphate kinase
MAKCISDGWLNKKKTSDLISNPKIDEIVDTALKEGADAGKVSGAGGGGFMMFFVPIEKRVHLTRVLNQFGGYVQNCHFTTKGSETWVV